GNTGSEIEEEPCPMPEDDDVIDPIAVVICGHGDVCRVAAGPDALSEAPVVVVEAPRPAGVDREVGPAVAVVVHRNRHGRSSVLRGPCPDAFRQDVTGGEIEEEPCSIPEDDDVVDPITIVA